MGVVAKACPPKETRSEMKQKKAKAEENVGRADEGAEPRGNGAPAGRDEGPSGSAQHDHEARIRELEQQVAHHEGEARANYDRFLRERADLENLKKRAARDREEALRYGNEALVRDILPVVDNLERALEHADSSGGDQALLDGVNLVLKGLLDALERHGAVCIPALGQRFDPERHEAMVQVESDEHEPNTVVREHQKGYVLRDRLIRPALVAVSKPREVPQSSEGGNSQAGDWKQG
jgi:molecular chaperone GrpE